MDHRLFLEPLNRRHLPLLQTWLAEPLVQRWWHHETTPKAVERDFGPSIDGADATEMFVVHHGGAPVGFVQRYRIDDYPEYVEELSALVTVAPGALSLDYFLGEPDARGLGLGAAVVRHVVEASWTAYPAAGVVIVPVHADNERSWRALESAGFTRVAEGELEPDNPADSLQHYVYALSRPASGTVDAGR